MPGQVTELQGASLGERPLGGASEPRGHSVAWGWCEWGQRAETGRKNPGRISFFSSPSVFSWRKYPLKLMPSLAGGMGCSTILCLCREAPAQDLAYTCPVAVEEVGSRDAQGRAEAGHGLRLWLCRCNRSVLQNDLGLKTIPHSGRTGCCYQGQPKQPRQHVSPVGEGRALLRSGQASAAQGG